MTDRLLFENELQGCILLPQTLESSPRMAETVPAVVRKVRLSVPTVLKFKPRCQKFKPGCRFENAGYTYAMFSFKIRNICHLKLFYQVIPLVWITFKLSDTIEVLYLHQSMLDKV